MSVDQKWVGNSGSYRYPDSRAVWREVNCFIGWEQPCKVCGVVFNSRRQRLYCDDHKDPRNRTAAAIRLAEKP